MTNRQIDSELKAAAFYIFSTLGTRAHNRAEKLVVGICIGGTSPTLHEQMAQRPIWRQSWLALDSPGKVHRDLQVLKWVIRQPESQLSHFVPGFSTCFAKSIWDGFFQRLILFDTPFQPSAIWGRAFRWQLYFMVSRAWYGVMLVNVLRRLLFSQSVYHILVDTGL